MFGPHRAPHGNQDEDDEREPKRPKNGERAPSSAQAPAVPTFRIIVITMTGAAIAIDGVSAADSIRSVKERVFAANRKLYVRRQRLVYSAGPRGIDPLADDETLGGAGLAQDGSAELDVLLVDLTEAEVKELGGKLLDAAKNGRVTDVLELLDEGVNVEFKDERGDTVLMCAARSGHTDCVRLLLDSGADKEGNNNGETALIRATEWGRTDCVRLLLDVGADKEARTNCHDGFTTLMCAAFHGNTDCLRVLVEAGGSIGATDSGGRTAIMLAAMNGFPSCVQRLLEIEADAHAKDNFGWTALIFAAAADGRVSVDDDPAAVLAVETEQRLDRIECVRLLLESGADTNVKTVHGGSALIQASWTGCTECVRLLLKAGADKDAMNDHDGHTSLIVAAMCGHTDCVRLLLEAGADKRTKDAQGLTALAHARAKRNQTIIGLLTASDVVLPSAIAVALTL